MKYYNASIWINQKNWILKYKILWFCRQVDDVDLFVLWMHIVILLTLSKYVEYNDQLCMYEYPIRPVPFTIINYSN